MKLSASLLSFILLFYFTNLTAVSFSDSTGHPIEILDHDNCPANIFFFTFLSKIKARIADHLFRKHTFLSIILLSFPQSISTSVVSTCSLTITSTYILTPPDSHSSSFNSSNESTSDIFNPTSFSLIKFSFTCKKKVHDSFNFLLFRSLPSTLYLMF